jgi:hypothetical protein
MRREERAQQLWSLLAWAATNRQILTYGIVAKLTGVPPVSTGDFLRPIQQFCTENKLPALTSIVVQDETGIPGDGFIAAENVPAAQAEVFQHGWWDTPAPSAEQFADSYSRAPDRRGSSVRATEPRHLPITLIPPDANDFKKQFLRTRLAEMVITYRDGRIERKKWHGFKLKTSSNLMGNLRSRPKFRDGIWQAEGIENVTVRVLDSN